MELDWDAEIDTPATVAVIGAGPVGVEAALYARFLGYSVILCDAAKVGSRVLPWGAHQPPATWGELVSPLGLAALQAQGNAAELPTPDQRVSCREYVDRYLLPVARTDLLYDSVQIQSTVLSVSRDGCLEPTATAEQRAEYGFRLLIQAANRGQYSQLAEIVLDCSGLGMRRGLSAGGGLAIGEDVHRPAMLSGKVDVLGSRRSQCLGRHILMIGNDASACANALELAQLVDEQPETRLSWIFPARRQRDPSVCWFPDSVPDSLVEPAARLCASEGPGVVAISARGIEGLQHDAGRWSVQLQVAVEETLDVACDQLIDCSPVQRDWSYLHGLQLPLGDSDSPATPEPHYYLLGQKLDANCRLATMQGCLERIRLVFAWIGGRRDLNLYDVIQRQMGL